MNALKTILEEAIGMFVDDGMLALLCAMLIVAAAVAVLALGVPGLWAGLLLLVGCIAILALSVFRASR
jgi:hypothetical protein